MRLEIPDECLSSLQLASIERLIERLKRADWTDIVVECSIDGEDNVYQADWLKHLKIG